MTMTPHELAQYIDHTALKPEATPAQIEQLCREALEYHFASVCVNPIYVATAARLLAGSGVKVCAVAGFPLGANTTEMKVAEAHDAIRLGAQEIDMVIWVGGLKAGREAEVEADIAAVATECHKGSAILKVIFECALLTDEEKKRACALCVRANADFVKTSTGFGLGGATEADVRLMSETVRSHGLGVKAAGGIRNRADALKMIEAGATRIGASASVRIMAEVMNEERRGSVA